MGEDYEESLRRLAEIEAEIEELTRIDEIMRRIEKQEKLVKELQESLARFAKKEDVENFVKSSEKRMKDYFERKAKFYEESQEENVRRLAEIDSEIIDKLRKVERFMDRVKGLELEIKKLRDILGTFVRKDEFETFRIGTDEKIERARFPGEELKEMDRELHSLRELLESLPRRSELVDLKKDIKMEEIDELKKYLESRIEAAEKKLEEHVKGLSQIDSEIINKLRNLEQFFGRLNEQILTLRKREYERFVRREIPAT
jgi:chromosome segregation ATPase